MAKKKTYAVPNDGKHYYEGYKFGAINAAAEEEDKDETNRSAYDYYQEYALQLQQAERERQEQYNMAPAFDRSEAGRRLETNGARRDNISKSANYKSTADVIAEAQNQAAMERAKQAVEEKKSDNVPELFKGIIENNNFVIKEAKNPFGININNTNSPDKNAGLIDIVSKARIVLICMQSIRIRSRRKKFSRTRILKTD